MGWGGVGRETTTANYITASQTLQMIHRLETSQCLNVSTLAINIYQFPYPRVVPQIQGHKLLEGLEVMPQNHKRDMENPGGREGRMAQQTQGNEPEQLIT